jgi:hypothetical protein
MVVPGEGGPQRPVITKRDILAQVNVDIRGKEVQTAETYSHSWIANQFGHVCIGIVLTIVSALAVGPGWSLVVDWLGLPSSWKVAFPWDSVGGAVLATGGIAWWEWKAYRHEVKESIGRFPLDRKLLRDNAITAAAYMVLGVATTLVYGYLVFTTDERWLGVPTWIWGTLCILLLMLIAILLAVPWLRQKIIWQKAGLPYLFRLADAQPTMQDEAHTLDALINGPAPPDCVPRQIVVGGPIGSGRTEICAGLGTEFAFKAAAVRYLTLGALLEFIARSGEADFFDDTGPANIAYWPWSRAQVVIIDDIGPLLIAKSSMRDAHVEQFGQILDNELRAIRDVLAKCHTVWVIGDPRRDGQPGSDDELLDQFARRIGSFCNPRVDAAPQVMVIQLEEGNPQQIPKAPRARIRYVSPLERMATR